MTRYRYAPLSGSSGRDQPQSKPNYCIIFISSFSIFVLSVLVATAALKLHDRQRTKKIEGSEPVPPTGTKNVPETSSFTDIVPVSSSTPDLNTEILNPTGEKVSWSKDRCTTKHCLRVLSSMDLETDPCQDFYKFSCGNWRNIHPRPTGTEHWTNFVRLDRRNVQTIRKGLEKRGKVKHTSKIVKKTRLFYNQCLGRDKITISESKKELDAIFSSIKFKLSNENPGTDLAELLGDLFTRFGVQPFFSLSVSISDTNSSLHILKMDEPNLIFSSRNYYSKDERDRTRPLLTNYIKDIFHLVEDGSPEEAVPEHLYHNLTHLEFELGLDETKPENHRILEHSSNILTVQELQDKYNLLDWGKLLNKTIRSKDDETLSTKTKMNIISERYMKRVSAKISSLLQSKEGRELISLFCFWKVYESLIENLSHQFRSIQQTFKDEVKGYKKRVLKSISWITCIRETESMFKYVLSNIYLKETDGFSSSVVEEATKILHRVGTSVEKNLEKNTWMDPETRTAAVNKSKKIHGLVGFSSIVGKLKSLERMYGKIEIGSSYLETKILYMKQNQAPDKLWDKLHKNVSPHFWVSSPQKINAFYATVLNQIIIPFGILQEPFFSSHRPEELNYGGIGFSFGHELSHGFDDNGRKYDGDGNLKDWWNEESLAGFKEKTLCLENQFANYSLYDTKVNPRDTLGEIIADNGGIKAAWDAFIQYTEKKAQKRRKREDDNEDGDEDKDKDQDEDEDKNEFEDEDYEEESEDLEIIRQELGFTPEQLFFIGFSQVWCNDNSREYEISKMESDPHPPSELRVRAAISNSAAFGSAFRCPLGSPMNPENKCDIW